MSRRRFLRVGALTAGGLSLSQWLRLQEAGAAAKNSNGKAVIQFYLEGGLTHHDSYDPKPEAPAGIRGPFSTVQTAVPGLLFSELLPAQARLADRLTALRGVHHGTADHATGQHWMLTGYPGSSGRAVGRNDQPATGSVVSALRGSNHPGLPAYTTLSNRKGGYEYRHGAYLGVAHSPFDIFADPNLPDYKIRNLSLSSQLNVERLTVRRELAKRFDRLKSDVDQSGNAEAIDRFSQQAFDLITGQQAQRAFDISREPAQTRDVYGRNRVGQATLLARRLVEAGVSFVTMHDVGWDNHSKIGPAMRRKLPQLDQAIAALIADLELRGKLDDVFIMVIGEFGRTPRINTNAGRDHWGNVFSVLLAGGGLQHGGAYGASNVRGETPINGAVRPGDILATMYQHLGLSPETTIPDFSGRPVYLLPEGQPIAALL